MPNKVWHWNHNHLLAYLLGISLLLTTLIGGVLFLFISLEIPDLTSFASYTPPTTTIILDDHGSTVARISKQNRFIVPISRMPEQLPKAFVAAEDARFYQHSGVDTWSILRAFLNNLRTGGRGQGGSTITQQVARSLLLSREKTYTRKIKEAILAFRIDNTLSKDEILQIYLNEIYLGAGAYGVEAAAQTYFDKHVWELNLAEVALLAGLPQAPSRYSPFRHFKLAKKRQAYVLNRMAEEGLISPTAARKAYRQPLLWGPDVQYPEENEYFIQQVKNYVENKYGHELLTTGGLQIYTTLNQNLQKAATTAVKLGVTKWAIRQNAAAEKKSLPQAALVAIEATTGEIKALVGGTNFEESQFNRATQAIRQPGSAFKPIIYAEALRHGFTPATLINDEPIRLQGSSPGEIWEPQNFSGKFFGPTTLRDGLIYSRNIVTIKLLQGIGVPSVIQLARDVGITSPLASNLSLALGSSDLSILELTAAYAVFANQGRYREPIFITRIEDSEGHILEKHHTVPVQILDESTAYQVTHLLKGVIEEGTGKSVKGLGVPAAGKTGTTDQNMDAWFIGYTPELVTGVWVGYDQKMSLGKGETGGKAAAPIWLDFMEKAQDLYPSADFPVPEGIAIVPMDSKTGKIVTSYSDNISWEAFKKKQLLREETKIPQGLSEFSPL